MTPRQLTQTVIALLAIVALFTSAAQAQPKPNPDHAETRRTVLNVSALRPGDRAMLAVELEVKPGYHAQSRTPLDKLLIKFDLKVDKHPALTFGEPVYPEGQIEEYPQLGKLSVYTGTVVVRVPVEVSAGAPLGDTKITGRLRYQICDDAACYPPVSPTFEVPASVVAAGTEVSPNEPDLFENSESHAPVVPAAAGGGAIRPAAVIAPSSPEAGWGMWTWFGAAVVAGLLFNVMPCVLPVLPLKAVGFYEASHHNRGKSFALGVVFSLGLISVFAVLALVVLVFRFISWGELFSKAWFIWGVIVPLLTLMGIGLLGGWNLSLPLGVYTFEPRHDTFGGNFFWGVLTAILATPCTAPLLPGLLLWASSQPVYVGVPAMLLVGVGMALPYLVLSAFPELAKRFPRTGPWSELFKQMMGFMMLAAAAYFAGGRLMHGTGFWWLVVAVVAVAALFLVARTVQLTPNSRPVVVSAALAVAMLGATLWWTAKITGLTQPAIAGVAASWTPYSDDAFERLRGSGKPVLVKFTANWCATCQVIEGTVFRDPAVWESLKSHNVATVKVDLTHDDAPGKDLLLKLNPAGGIPLTAIFTPGKDEPLVLASVYSSAELLRALDAAVPPALAASE